MRRTALLLLASNLHAQTNAADAAQTLDSAEQLLDGMGPVSLGKDGSLNRIANWQELTAAERETAVRLLSARNLKRKRILLEKEQTQQRRKDRAFLTRFSLWFSRLFSRKSLPDLDFAPEFVAAIANGTKRATTRYVAREGEPELAALRVHDSVRATCRRCVDELLPIGSLTIVRIERVRCDQLNATLAAVEGFASADDLRAALRRFYPSLRARDPLIVLHFRPPESHTETESSTSTSRSNTSSSAAGLAAGEDQAIGGLKAEV